MSNIDAILADLRARVEAVADEAEECFRISLQDRGFSEEEIEEALAVGRETTAAANEEQLAKLEAELKATLAADDPRRLGASLH
jgi:hypothetical protein